MRHLTRRRPRTLDLTPAPERKARNFAVLAHLGAFALFFPVPLSHVSAPLLVWLFRSGESEFTEEHATEALNFQISMTLHALVVLMLVLIGINLLLLLPLLLFADLSLALRGAFHASEGKEYRYPMTIRLLR